jgi:predicted AAA+ superfamily ATPase
VQAYLEIHEDTLFTFRLPAFEARLRVRERRHPKLYWVDPGLVRAVISDRGPPDADSVGRLFEGWVAQLLRAYRDYRKIFDDLVYWAPTESGEAEVDFLLHCGRERLAIEVKASRRRKPEHARGDFARSPAFLASAAASSSTLVRSGSDPREESRCCRSPRS